MFGICNLAIIPLRIEPSDRSEIVSQVLFGEHFEILEQQNNGLKSNYNLMIMKAGLIQTIPNHFKSSYNQLCEEVIVLNSDLIEYVTGPNNLLMPIPLGSSLSFLKS
jgi:hypothetical protein